MPFDQIPTWVGSLYTSNLAYAVLFGLCVLEGAMMLRFMPSELLVPSALYFMGASLSTVVVVVAIAVVGTTIGQVLLFGLVRKGGREWILERRWFPVSEPTLDRFDGWFERWGAIIVPVSNTSLFIRGVFTVPAGLSEMDASTFVLISAIGSLSFEVILAGLYVFGGHLLA